MATLAVNALHVQAVLGDESLGGLDVTLHDEGAVELVFVGVLSADGLVGGGVDDVSGHCFVPLSFCCLYYTK